LIAKVIAHGPSRREAIDAARTALREFRIEGIITTLPLHLRILDHPSFLKGEYDLGLLDAMAAAPGPVEGRSGRSA